MRPAEDDDLLHPRLTVVWADAPTRAGLLPMLRDDVRCVDRDGFDRRVRRLREEVRDDRLAALAAVEDQLAALDVDLTAAEQALALEVADRTGLEQDAEWCLHQPELDRADVAAAAALTGSLDELRAEVRDATRQVERVVEQRAAAETAFTEARRELEGLGVSGADESDVRRQLEAASAELRAASQAYQEATDQLARRRAELALVDSTPGPTPPVARPPLDQMDVMRAALEAKWGGAVVPETPDPIDAPAATRAVEDAQQVVGDAAERLAAARQEIADFEQELERRSADGDELGSRREAAGALEVQITSVEQRLAESESVARAQVERATRALAAAELALEQLGAQGRDRRRRLRTLSAAARLTDVPGSDDDILSHADRIAGALRTAAASMDDGIDAARAVVEDLGQRIVSVRGQRDGLRGRLDGEDPRDQVTALRALLIEGAAVTLLDDVVGCDDAPLTTAALAEVVGATDPTPGGPRSPLVVLTSDADVVGWAIELPPEYGQVVNLGVVRPVLAAGPPRSPDIPARSPDIPARSPDIEVSL